MVSTYHSQIAIIGGGICGLWLLARLRQAGYDAILLERDRLGGGQTLASQGMIHGGIKYALGGFPTPASQTSAAMPARWRNCLAGNEPPDLRGVNLLSEEYFLFTDQRLASKITAFFGSKSMRGRIQALKRQDYPPAFANEAFKGALYRLEDIVVDTGALVRKLAGDHADRIFQADPLVRFANSAHIEALEINGKDLTADRYVFAAGAGNEALLSGTPIRMQRRPLKQVMIKHSSLAPVFAHAVSAVTGATPRVTITTHRINSGTPVLVSRRQSGGKRGPGAPTAGADRLRASGNRGVISVDRSGGQRMGDARRRPGRTGAARPQPSGLRPTSRQFGNAFVCWRTKLTLTPILADQVLAALPAVCRIG
ncbi:MAG: FAD-dependent oxidoreductase [Gammaproteobacteria bacterium]|nr:FAD-dependent oxidoreductase [Gammaproteobacteria bacterium]